MIDHLAGHASIDTDVLACDETRQTMRTLATNMAFLLEKTHDGGSTAPKRDERPQFMNFIR